MVGNGEGTAGWGLGKDGDATAALVKAVRAAKKNMLHIQRFDNRTIFHDLEDKWAKCKVRSLSPILMLTPLPYRRATLTFPLARHGRQVAKVQGAFRWVAAIAVNSWLLLLLLMSLLNGWRAGPLFPPRPPPTSHPGRRLVLVRP